MSSSAIIYVDHFEDGSEGKEGVDWKSCLLNKCGNVEAMTIAGSGSAAVSVTQKKTRCQRSVCAMSQSTKLSRILTTLCPTILQDL